MGAPSVKHLFLLRHAKSSWDEPSLSDSERPLNGRGRRDAPRMGEALGARLVPMTFYVSPAERAQQTFRAVQRNWKGLKKRHCVTTRALYTFDYREVLDWMSQQLDELERLALVGHNPAFTELINYFVGPGTLENLPTAGWAELILPIDKWPQVAALEGRGELVYLLFPKELMGAD